MKTKMKVAAIVAGLALAGVGGAACHAAFSPVARLCGLVVVWAPGQPGYTEVRWTQGTVDVYQCNAEAGAALDQASDQHWPVPTTE